MASAEATEDGHAIGVLAAWDGEEAPFHGASKVDAAVVDPGGPAAWVSCCLAPPDAGLPFDDPAVSAALRAVLERPAFDLVSTLLVGSSHFVGSLVAVQGDDPRPLAEDPFARLFPPRLLRVSPGLFGRTLLPVGPGTQRWGSSSPWPADGFAG